MKNFTSLLVFMSTVTCFSQNSLKQKSLNEPSSTQTVLATSNFKFALSTTEINSKQSEIGSSFFKEKYIMYSSKKTGEIGAGKDPLSNEPFTNLYCLKVDESGNLSLPLFFIRALKSNGNQAGLTFSPDETVVYYTKSTKDNSNNYKLYKSILEPVCKCEWVNEVEISLSGSSYSIENPIVNSDGTKIYFSSNMPGGLGGFDLYEATLNTDGIPVNPRNLGNIINTNKDETHPYISKSNDELYFSSAGHIGYGGKDVFCAKIQNFSYGRPVNLGNTLNTASDEVAFILSAQNQNRGYISSNRQSGIGLYDIFKFEMTRTQFTVSGFANEIASKSVLPNTTFTLLDENQNIVATTTSNEDGKFNFDVILAEKYTIIAEKLGYETLKTPFSTSQVLNSKVELSLRKIANIPVENKTRFIAIEKIYFDFDKSTIKKESEISLKNLINIMNEKPAMKIFIKAHTDSKGTDQYNIALSKNRALQTKKFLIKNGIEAAKLRSEGFGETQTLSNCNENCTDQEDELDRRVEFVIE